MKVNIFLLLILSIASCERNNDNVTTVTGEQKIRVLPSMLTQTTGGVKNGELLFDGNGETFWFPGGPNWDKSTFPARLEIRFTAPLKITKIRVYDMDGGPTLTISDAYWSVNTVLDRYETWREIPINKTAGMITLSLDSMQGDKQMTEVEIYATDADTKPPKDTTVIITPIQTSRGEADKINLCGFHWVPLDKLKPFHSIRIYAASNWVWQKNGLYVEPMYQAGSPNVPGYDTYLKAAKDQGLQVIPCINQTPAWYRRTWGNDMESLGDDYPPVKPGGNRTDPKSYSDYAEFWSQFVMRYGSVTHPIEKLKVDKTPRWLGDVPNGPKTGLGLIKQVEIWNEPDKWWKINGTDKTYMEAPEYAAMLSACYDAVKAADSKVQVVMAGLTGFDMAYLNEMDAWFKSNGMTFKADVVNVHHYSNRGNELGRWPPTWYEGGAVPPELDKDFPGIAPVVKFARERGKKIWVTEFGSDTRAPSWMYATPVGGYGSEQLQAIWLVRTYLEYIRYGVDNMFMFNAVNEPGEINGGLYINSGLMYGEKSDRPYQPKPSYTAVTKLIGDLTGAKYAGDLSTPEVRILAFKYPATGKTKVFYWSPTMDGRTVAVNLGGGALTATETPQVTEILSLK